MRKKINNFILITNLLSIQMLHSLIPPCFLSEMPWNSGLKENPGVFRNYKFVVAFMSIQLINTIFLSWLECKLSPLMCIFPAGDRRGPPLTLSKAYRSWNPRVVSLDPSCARCILVRSYGSSASHVISLCAWSVRPPFTVTTTAALPMRSSVAMEIASGIWSSGAWGLVLLVWRIQWDAWTHPKRLCGHGLTRWWVRFGRLLGVMPTLWRHIAVRCCGHWRTWNCSAGTNSICRRLNCSKPCLTSVVEWTLQNACSRAVQTPKSSVPKESLWGDWWTL